MMTGMGSESIPIKSSGTSIKNGINNNTNRHNTNSHNTTTNNNNNNNSSTNPFGGKSSEDFTSVTSSKRLDCDAITASKGMPSGQGGSRGGSQGSQGLQGVHGGYNSTTATTTKGLLDLMPILSIHPQSDMHDLKFGGMPDLHHTNHIPFVTENSFQSSQNSSGSSHSRPGTGGWGGGVIQLVPSSAPPPLPSGWEVSVDPLTG